MRKQRGNLWQRVIVAYLGGECVHCKYRKSKTNLEINHIIPLSRGGENTMGNLEVVCVKCHEKISAMWIKHFPLKKTYTTNCLICGITVDGKLKKKFCSNCAGRRRLDRGRKNYKSYVGITATRKAVEADALLFEKIKLAL